MIKELIKYMKASERYIVSGQDGKSGMWYCKELKCDNEAQTRTKISNLNGIYNEVNANIIRESQEELEAEIKKLQKENQKLQKDLEKLKNKK